MRALFAPFARHITLRWAAFGVLLIVWLAIDACDGSEPRDISCEAPPLELLSESPRFALIASDYASSSLALLDEMGGIMTQRWLDSGSAAPRLVAALSGDVVLPTRPPDACSIALLDRYGTDVLTLLNHCTEDESNVLRFQIEVGGGFRANPYDVLAIDDQRLWVSRFEHDPLSQEGNDVVVIDRVAVEIVTRFDFGALDRVVEDERIRARPARMVHLVQGDHARVVVGLARLSEDFMRSAPGGVGLLDPSDGERGITELPLEYLSNCTEVDFVAGDPSRALVTCHGATFGDEEARRAEAGIVMLHLDTNGRVEVELEYLAADMPQMPVYASHTVSLGGALLVSVAMGNFLDQEPDRMAVLDVRTGTATPFWTSEPFELGEAAYDEARRVLLVPDAGRSRVVRFDVGLDAQMRLGEELDLSLCHGLPPREIRLLESVF